MMVHKKSFFLFSLGCPKNEVDSDGLASMLMREGWAMQRHARDAGVMVVNTCSFVAAAVEESLETIMELADLREDGGRRLVVSGCLVSRYGGGTLAPLLPEVDMWVDMSEYHRFAALLDELIGEEPTGEEGGGRDRAATLERGFVYVKIAEGCSRRCSFCAIPAIRGPLSSRPREEIVEEARLFTRHGAREIVLVAQDTTSYGLDLYGRTALPDLLSDLREAVGEAWLRVMYTYPEGVDDALLRAMADYGACRYLDLPFQHSDAGVLKAMGRRGDAGSHLRLLARIGELMGEVALRATFMVGFPGEDGRAFADLAAFVAGARFDWLGLFGYSQEEGTPAFSLGKGASASVTRARLQELAAVQEEIMREKAVALVGNEMRVLLEQASSEAPGFWEGRTWREAPEIDGVVFVADTGGLRAGSMVDVAITSSEGVDLVGTVKRG
ncbi:MAG: 30S ribosomal protein S12 methylthiotransferase RimO [Actinomycetota bacterium]